MIKQELYRIKGIRNNESISVADKEHAYDVKNMDIYAKGDAFSLSVCKGHTFYKNIKVPKNQKIVGKIVCDDDLVLFTVDGDEEGYSKTLILDDSIQETKGILTSKNSFYTEDKTVVKYYVKGTLSRKITINNASTASTSYLENYNTGAGYGKDLTGSMSREALGKQLISVNITPDFNTPMLYVHNGGGICDIELTQARNNIKIPNVRFTTYEARQGDANSRYRVPSLNINLDNSDLSIFEESLSSTNDFNLKIVWVSNDDPNLIGGPFNNFRISFSFKEKINTTGEYQYLWGSNTTELEITDESDIDHINYCFDKQGAPVIKDGDSFTASYDTYGVPSDQWIHKEADRFWSIYKKADGGRAPDYTKGDKIYLVFRKEDNKIIDLTYEGIYKPNVKRIEESGSLSHIYRISLKDYKDKDGNDTDFLNTTELYSGYLNFKTSNPIKAVYNNVNSNLRFVYFTDGVNPLRVINICNTYTGKHKSIFDFKSELKGNEEVTIRKEQNSQGLFSSGAIQYMFTYVNKDLSETNIAYVSPTLYTSFADRAGSPEESVQCAFSFEIKNVNQEFSYLRLYSVNVTQTSAVAKCIKDFEISSSVITYTDLNREGYSIDQYDLLYKNRSNFTAECINLKNNTLFVGNITELNNIPDTSKLVVGGRNYIKNHLKNNHDYAGTGKVTVTQEESAIKVVYPSEYTAAPGYTPNNYISFEYGSNIRGTKKEYTFSFEVKCDASIENYAIYYEFFGTTFNINLTTEWQKLTTTGIAPDRNGALYLCWGGRDKIKGHTLYIKNIKLELGNIATEYTPQIEQDTITLNAKNKMGQIPILEYFANRDYGIDTFNFYKGSNTCPLTFKLGQKYILGIQLQRLDGVWEDPFESGLGGEVIGKPMVYYRQYIQSLSRYILDNYIAIRPMIKKVKFEEKSWLTQGIVCPTVASIAKDFNPNIQSSWFFRSGKIPYTHLAVVGGESSRDFQEIQGIPFEYKYSDHVNTIFISENDNEKKTHNEEKAQNVFKCVNSYVTFNTLDTEIELKIDSTNKLKGIKDFSDCNGIFKYEIQYDTLPIWTDGTAISNYSGDSASGFWYRDGIVDDKDSSGNYMLWWSTNEVTPTKKVYWKIMPWQKPVVNNDVRRPDGFDRSSKIKKKVCLQNITLSGNAFTNEYNIYEGSIFNQGDVAMIKFKNSYDPIRNTRKDLIYYGNIDTSLNPATEYSNNFWTNDVSGDYNMSTMDCGVFGTEKGWFIRRANATSGNPCFYNGLGLDQSKNPITHIGDYNTELRGSMEAIRMKYKSSPHYILKVVDNSLPQVVTWNHVPKPGLYDIIKPTYEVENNDWIIAGDQSPIEVGRYLDWKWGDTFYGNVEFLKTYPFTTEDVNQVITIMSADIESSHNMYGRYDRNIGKGSFATNINNFGKYNNNYDIINDFFLYTVDKEKKVADNHPNTIMWSNSAYSTDHNSSLSSISLASSYNCLDNSKVTNILLFNNELYALQEKAFNKIMFNSRIQLQASDGIPIELGNSQKVDDIVQIYQMGGTKAISTQQGIFFSEEYSNDLYNYTGQSCTNISQPTGYNFYKKTKELYFDDINLETFVIYSDHLVKINLPNTTVVSKADGDFYNLFSYKGEALNIDYDGDYYYKIFKCFKKHYYNNAYVTYRCNPDLQSDKVFNNIDFRTEMYDSEGNDIYDKTWTSIYGSNEYQDSYAELIFDKIRPSFLKRKFRIWRAFVPRMKRQRLRNPWIQLQLVYNNGNENYSDEYTKYDKDPYKLTKAAADSNDVYRYLPEKMTLERGCTYAIYCNSTGVLADNHDPVNNTDDKVTIWLYSKKADLHQLFVSKDNLYEKDNTYCFIYTVPFTSDDWQFRVNGYSHSVKYTGISFWGFKAIKIPENIRDCYKPFVINKVNIPTTIYDYTIVLDDLKPSTRYIYSFEVILEDPDNIFNDESIVCIEFVNTLQKEVTISVKEGVYTKYNILLETPEIFTGDRKVKIKWPRLLASYFKTKNISLIEDTEFTNNKFVHHDMLLLYSL